MLNHAEREHALLSASGASRWLACTPSARLEEDFPEETSVYAEEGTLAHEFAELEARKALGDLSYYLYKKQMDALSTHELYDEEMSRHAKTYAALVKTRYEEAKEQDETAIVFLETRLDYSEWVPEGFGTADCAILADGILEIIDFKYGRGVQVSPEGNPQMRLYALGMLHLSANLYDVKAVRMTIFQPRLSTEPLSAEVNVEDLLEWAETEVVEKANAAFKGEGDFAPSEDACKFCKAKGVCRARAEKFIELFDEVQDTALLTPDEVGALLLRANDMKAWLADLEGTVYKTLQDGAPVEGWKLVQGRSVRKITDQEEALQRLIDAGYKKEDLIETKLSGLTALEKLVGKEELPEILGQLLVKPEGKATLAVEEDPRPNFNPVAQILSAFEDA